METVKHVGDIHSDERGSGARWNGGKTPYEYLPLAVVLKWSDHMPFGSIPEEIIELLGKWQKGDNHAIGRALVAACGGSVTLPELADAAEVFKAVTTREVNPYPLWNWAKGQPWSVPYASALRHCLKILAGEETDPETGKPHLAHVKCNLLMLLTYAETYPEGDDRPVKWLSPRPEYNG